MLHTLKLKAGDTICILSQNCIEYLDLFFACGKTGIILAPVKTNLKNEVTLELVERITPELLIYDEKFIKLNDYITTNLPSIQTISLEEVSQKYTSSEYASSYSNTINTPSALNDTAMLIATGGSTGSPKICKISHRQIIWNSFEVMAFGYWGKEKKELVVFPFNHFGGWNSFLCSFMAGRQSVIIPEFNAKQICDAINQEKIAHFGIETIMLYMLQQDKSFEEINFDYLDGITVAGTPFNKNALKPILNKKIPILQAYGLTEAGPSNFCNHTVTEERNSPSTEYVGHPMFFCDYKITDSPNSASNNDSNGILYLRSMHNFSGYFNDEKLTKQTISKDGWINSSDIVSLNKENGLKILERAEKRGQA